MVEKGEKKKFLIQTEELYVRPCQDIHTFEDSVWLDVEGMF